MQSCTWHELETSGKFDKNKKLSFISDEMLIIGCNVGSETHYVRSIDTRGRELSKTAFPFSNSFEGFQSIKSWAAELAVQNEKHQIVLSLEPTGHYWFCLASWLIANRISVVQVNPYAVKQTKEIEDNSQSKDDRKDPKLIANLVKDGNSGKHQGQTKISHRGRKRLRYWLFQAAKSAVCYAEEFKASHEKKKQVQRKKQGRASTEKFSCKKRRGSKKQNKQEL